MADYLASRMYKSHLDLYHCVILAAYTLFQAKEHVVGCGGDSQIAVLRNEGPSGYVEHKRIAAMTELLQWADEAMGTVLLNAASLELDNRGFREMANGAIEGLEALRGGSKARIEREERNLMLLFGLGETQKDQFGLTIPKSDDPEGSTDENA